MPPDTLHDSFRRDLDDIDSLVMATTQRPLTRRCFDDVTWGTGVGDQVALVSGLRPRPNNPAADPGEDGVITATLPANCAISRSSDLVMCAGRACAASASPTFPLWVKAFGENAFHVSAIVGCSRCCELGKACDHGRPGVGKASPNMGSPLWDSSAVASSWMTSQCSASRPSSIRTMSATIQSAGCPTLRNRPCSIT
jgi:hypothetical protein